MSPVAQKILGLKINILPEIRRCEDRVSVVISNHQNLLDIIIVGSFVPKRFVTLAARGVRRIPVFGYVFYLAGNIFVDRSSKESRSEGISRMSHALKVQKTSIMIFPEGTRSKGRGLGEFKRGAFHCAVTNKVPIQAVAISSLNHIDFTKWQAGSILVKHLPMIETAHLAGTDVEKLMLETHALMKSTIAELDQMITPRSNDAKIEDQSARSV